MEKNYWEKYAETFDRVYALRHKYFLGPALMDFLGDVHGRSVIDLGCGAGHYTNTCAKKGAKVIGIDASSTMLEIAKIFIQIHPLFTAMQWIWTNIYPKRLILYLPHRCF